MSNRDENLEKNISRLIKLMRDSEQPGEAFMESLTESAVAGLGPKEDPKQRFRTIRDGILSLGAAAVFLVAITLFISSRLHKDRGIEVASANSKSPCRMMTLMELNLAYSKGGIQAVDEQFDKAYSRLERQGKAISMNDLLNTL
jgi:hypothetical protein